MNVEAGFQIGDLQGIVRRRGKVVLGVGLVVALASYWLAMALPNEYESYATVLVEPQTVSPELIRAGVRESDLNRRLHLMAAQILSRPRLSRIIDELGLFEEESRYLVREEIINRMRNQIRVAPVVPELEQGRRRRSDGIDQFRIYYRDDDALVARDVAQHLANDFIEQHITARVKVSQKSLEFVEAELDRLGNRIREVEAQVAAVKAANPGRLPEDQATNQRALERLMGELAARRREAATARSDEAFFRSQGATALQLSRSGDDANPERRMQLLELALADHASRGFTEKHPDVIKTKGELEALRAQIARRQEQIEESDVPMTFAQHRAEAEAQRAGLRLRHAEEEIERIEGLAAEVQLLLAGVPGVAEQLDGLDREYRHLFASYQDFSQRRLQAGVQADLERRQLGEQFRVLESAFPAPEPTSPNRMAIVVIGTIFGLALGGGIGIVLEAADSSVHTAREIQRSIGLPVLASIPQIWLEADRARLRRSRVLTAAATLVLIVFALVGGALNYVWVNGSFGDGEPVGEELEQPKSADQTAALGEE